MPVIQDAPFPPEFPFFEKNSVDRWDGPCIYFENPDFDFKEALRSTIATHIADDQNPYSEGGVFSLSPLSTPNSSRCSSPAPAPSTHAARTPTPPNRVSYAVPGTSLPKSVSKPAPMPTTALQKNEPESSSAAPPPLGRHAKCPDHPHDKKRGRANRKKRRKMAKTEPNGPSQAQIRPSTQEKYLQSALSIQTNLVTKTLPVATKSFVANHGTSRKKSYRLDELVGEGTKYRFKLVEWDGRTATAIADSEGRLVAILAGRPDDPTWTTVHTDAADLLEKTRPFLTFNSEEKHHRHGRFSTLSYGISHGGGQTSPANLKQNPQNEGRLRDVVKHESFERIAGFGSSVLATWCPRLHSYFVDRFGKVLAHNPALVRNYTSSVFASAAVNFGPRTVCYLHTDSANLPFGLCAITSLGAFDFTRGGHIVLWQCRLVIQFPPGSTVLIPSAVISHCNTSIGSDERRYSFTQYSAGSLFRWAEHGFKLDQDFYASLSPEEKEEDDRANQERWGLGLSMLPLVTELSGTSR